jgi:hypothetical protein
VKPAQTNYCHMKNLTDPRWIKLKGILFLVVGLFSATLLILEAPTLRVTVLLVISIWCFCRFYYFAFYVIERYVDPGWRFSGLWSFFLYLLRKRGKDKPPP